MFLRFESGFLTSSWRRLDPDTQMDPSLILNYRNIQVRLAPYAHHLLNVECFPFLSSFLFVALALCVYTHLCVCSMPLMS